MGLPPRWTIGELARRAGMRPSALRYYESAGILPPPRRVNGRRRYDPAALERLRAVRLAQSAGLTLREVRALFAGFAPETPPAARWQALAAPKLAELDAQIARARTAKERLTRLLACACPSLEVCASVACE
jgi:DNA-binding transcriptional MerR regulator